MAEFHTTSKCSTDYLDVADNLNGSEKSSLIIEALKRVTMGPSDTKIALLEVGPGGGAAAAEVLRFIEQQNLVNRTTMSFLELDGVLSESLLQVCNTSSVKTNMMTGNMCKLGQSIEANSVDILSASAVLHEVYSYNGGMRALDSAIKSTARVLKPGGYFAYRDVFTVNHLSTHDREKIFYPRQSVWPVFIAHFLPSYLERAQHSYHHTVDDELILEQFGQEVSVDLIDSRRDLFLSAPVGLHREIQRHLITLRDHLWRNGALGVLPVLDGPAGNDWINKERGIKNVHFSSSSEDPRITQSERDGEGNYVMSSNLFDEITEQRMRYFLHSLESPQNSKIWQEWQAREGSETYTYLTLNELFGYFAIKSIKATDGQKVLLPETKRDIHVIPRTYYDAYLRKTLSLGALPDAKQLVLFRAMDLREKTTRERVARQLGPILRQHCEHAKIVEIYRNLEI